jgi:ABC-type antimicrobial peptide transport system permease subunit
VTAQYFGVLGVPLLAGRDFNDGDRTSKELVAIVNQSVARRLFPNGDALNRRLTPTNLGTNLGNPSPARIVGVVADVDEDRVVQEPSMIVYYLLRGAGGSRMFVRATGDPRTLIPSVTRTIHGIAADQAVDQPATLEDIRAEVLAPERLNAFVFSALGGIALLIAIVGVAGVLAFSVSARTREFGVRLAVGSTPRELRASVLRDGVRIAAIGIATGAAGGYALVRVAEAFFGNVQLPGALPVIGAAVVLTSAAIAASFMPATRAARVDVLQALRSE